MTYLMKQKLFSWGEDFIIKDDSGQDRFFVDSKVFSIRNQLSFKDIAGNELAYIKQEAFDYKIFKNGELFATIEPEALLLKSRFAVAVTRGNDLMIEGDFFGYQYIVSDHRGPVAEVSKGRFALADTYSVNISLNQDDLLILACTVVIDLIGHSSGHA